MRAPGKGRVVAKTRVLRIDVKCLPELYAAIFKKATPEAMGRWLARLAARELGIPERKPIPLPGRPGRPRRRAS